jgi:hypothetical protein
MTTKKMKNSRYCIISLRSTMLEQFMCETKRQKKREKDVFSKVNIYHDKLYEDKKKHQQTKAVPVRTKKEKFSYDMEAEKNTGPKNTIV